MGAPTKLTPELIEQYLEAVRRTGEVNRPAYRLGITPESLRDRRDKDPDFAARFEEAKRGYSDLLHGEAHRRGVDGWEEPVFQKGEEVGRITRYDARLLELLLKRHDPEFRDKIQVDANVSGGVLVVGEPIADLAEWERKTHDEGRAEGRVSP